MLEDLLDPARRPDGSRLACGVIRLPHISNFTDFAPLGRDERVDLHYLSAPRGLGGYDLVVLPGTKNARSDAEWLAKTGWARVLREYAGLGGRIGGVCGGYQILGSVIRDPYGIEGDPGEARGLGLLDVTTEIRPEKVLRRSGGEWLAGGVTSRRVEGYEIHVGATERASGLAPSASLAEMGGGGNSPVYEDGARSADGRIWGTYLHGLFDSPAFRRAFIEDIRPDLAADAENEAAHGEGGIGFRDRQYDLLAGHFRAHLDLGRLCSIADPDGEMRLAERVLAHAGARGGGKDID